MRAVHRESIDEQLREILRRQLPAKTFRPSSSSGRLLAVLLALVPIGHPNPQAATSLVPQVGALLLKVGSPTDHNIRRERRVR